MKDKDENESDYTSQIGEYIHTETEPVEFMKGKDCVYVY
jgi:hypothetical protein